MSQSDRKLRALLAGILVLGLLSGCGSAEDDRAAPVGRCPALSFDTRAPLLHTTITLNRDTVRTGETFDGTVEFTNPGAEPINYPYNGSVEVALLYAAGTDTPVAVYTEPVTAAASALLVPPGGSASLRLVGGTTPCGPDAPTALAPGSYDVRVVLVTGLSDPASITVTD